MTDRHPETILDLSGLLCPLPVLKARKRLNELPSGSVLVVIATDPMTVIDIPHFCTEQGHVLQHTDREANRFVFRIKKAP